MEIIVIALLIILVGAAFLFGRFVGKRSVLNFAGDLVFDHFELGDSAPYMAISTDIETIKKSRYISLRVRHVGNSQK